MQKNQLLKRIGLTTLVSSAFLLGGCLDSSSDSDNDQPQAPAVNENFDPNETTEEGKLVVAQSVANYIESQQNLNFALRLADSLAWNLSSEDDDRLFGDEPFNETVDPEFNCTTGSASMALDNTSTDGFSIHGTFSDCLLQLDSSQSGQSNWRNLIYDGEEVLVDGEVKFDIPVFDASGVAGTITFDLSYTFNDIEYSLNSSVDITGDFDPSGLPEGIESSAGEFLGEVFSQEGTVTLAWQDQEVKLTNYSFKDVEFEGYGGTYEWIRDLVTATAIYSRTDQSTAFNLKLSTRHVDDEQNDALNSQHQYTLSAGEFEQVIKGYIGFRADHQTNLELESDSGGCNGTYSSDAEVEDWCSAN